MTLRHFGIALLAAAALLPLAGSCAKIETVTGTGEQEITYTLTPIKASTKATTAFDQNKTFGSRAYKLEAGKTWLNDRADAELYIPDSEISYQSDGKWRVSSGQRYYWRHDGSSLTFLSWAPYTFGGDASSLVSSDDLKIDDTSHEFTYTGWTMSATAGYGYTKDATTGNYSRNTSDGSVDLLLAKSTDRTSNDSAAGVKTDFVHQLCNIKVMATIMDDPGTNNKWEVTKVEISDIYTKADLLKAATTEVKTQIWGGHSDAATYTYTPTDPIELVYTSPTATEVEIFPQTLMIPQSVLTTSSSATRKPQITVTCNYTEGTTVTTKTLTGLLASNTSTDLTAWLAGKSITYHIYLSTVDYWIDFDAKATDWEKDDADHTITIGY
jgi:hypothetical protein